MSSNHNYSMFHQNKVKNFLYLHVLLKAICYNNTLENREKTGFPLSSTNNLTRINIVKPLPVHIMLKKVENLKNLKTGQSHGCFLFIFQKKFLAATTKVIFATTALLSL